VDEGSSGVSDLAEIARRIDQRSHPVEIAGLRGGSAAAAAAQLIHTQGNPPALLLVATAKRADRCVADVAACLGEVPAGSQGAGGAAEGMGRVLPFPRYDTPPYERFSPQPFVGAQRREGL